jgi:protein-S-isoprenylcysteine O-methyltransferase Ste14
VPAPIERSFFVLLASLALDLLFWQWRPLPMVVWQITTPVGMAVMWALFVAGWFTVLVSTFLISHLELFGLRQAMAEWSRRGMPRSVFRTPGLYRLIRHPIYLGFMLAFWSAPTMSIGHLLFALVTSACILVGIRLEERDLVGLFGDRYTDYRARVGMLVPKVRRSSLRAPRGAEGSALHATKPQKVAN